MLRLKKYEVVPYSFAFSSLRKTLFYEGKINEIGVIASNSDPIDIMNMKPTKAFQFLAVTYSPVSLQ